MDENEFKRRTRDVGLRVIRLVETLPNTRVANAIANQLIRCGTGIGANYRAACRGVSRRDVISKLGDVEEEATTKSFQWPSRQPAKRTNPKSINPKSKIQNPKS